MDGSKASPIMYFDDNGNGPHEHVCAGGGPVDRVQDWLDRRRLLGSLAPEVARAVEDLIEDLRRGEA